MRHHDPGSRARITQQRRTLSQPTGETTGAVTRQLEDGNDKMVAKGWTVQREDMLSSSTVRVTYVRGEMDEDDEEAMAALESMED